ncbi:MAG: sensor histidine kinase [Prevotellaceae bacterium]|jgi:signal transduction histidine kinase|nr:sensor histidine kinase [Prevotellaceae bacterium]
MKKIILICLTVLLACNIRAQSDVDSLVNILETQKLTSKEQLELYKKICIAYRFVDVEKTKMYCEKGIMLSQKENNFEVASYLCIYCGTSYSAVGNNDTALIYYQKSLDFGIKSENKSLIANIYNILGTTYMDIINLDVALEYLLKGLTFAEETNDMDIQSKILCNIGSTYRGLSQLDMSIRYMLKAESVAQQASIHIVQAIANIELGLLHVSKSENEKALTYVQKALDISRSNDLIKCEISSLNVMAIIYRTLKEYDKAMEYVNETLQLLEKDKDSDNSRDLLDIWTEMSNIYFEQQRYKDSEATAMKVWLADSSKVGILNIVKIVTLSNMYLGNNEKAVYFFDKYSDIMGAMFEQNILNTTIETEIKYETEKKEMKIAALEKEKILHTWIIIISIIAALCAFGILFYRHKLNLQKRKQAEQQIKQLEQEKQLVASQAIIEGEAAERSRLARDLHDGLGGMLSVVKLNLKDMKGYSILDNIDIDHFQKAMSMLDRSIDELRRVAHHIMPESLMRYGLKVSLDDFCRAIPGTRFQFFGDDTNLDNRIKILIYRCAYELINNAVKHANAVNINVQLMIDNGLISLSVHDDGIGFDPEKVKKGAGLENVRMRVATYNGKLNIYSSPDKGTEINIEIEPS